MDQSVAQQPIAAALPSLWWPAELCSGQAVLVVAARQTLRIDLAKMELQPVGPEDALPVQTEPRTDEGQPPEASVALESDLVAEKAFVDVLLVGHAVAPGNRPTPQWEVRLQIGERTVRRTVLGPRAVLPQPDKKDGKRLVPQPPQFGPPAPIASLPLSLRHAYGGISWWIQPQAERELAAKVADQLAKEQHPAAQPTPAQDGDDTLADAQRFACPTNPFGKGYCLSLDPRVLARLQLPQLEDPERPLTPDNLLQTLEAPDQLPQPAATTAIPRHCLPRAALAGVLPSARDQVQAAVQAQIAQLDLADPQQVAVLAGLRAQPEPPPLQPAYWNTAPTDLQWPAVYPGDVVTLTGVHPDGPLRFALPHETPLAELTAFGRTARLRLRLDTLVLEPQRLRVNLVWRATLPLDSMQALADGPAPQLIVRTGSADAPAPLSDVDGEGTRIDRQPWHAPPTAGAAAPVAVPAAPVAAGEALPLAAAGQLLQTSDPDWPASLQHGRPAAATAHPDRAQEEAAALAKLAAAQQALAQRRSEIATALSAGKPVPVPGANNQAQ